MGELNFMQAMGNEGLTKKVLVRFHNILGQQDWQPSELIAFGLYEQRQGYAADAIAQYQRALQKTGDAKTRAIELSNIGSAYLDMKDLDHAQQSFDEALRTDPNNVPALMGSGLV